MSQGNTSSTTKLLSISSPAIGSGAANGKRAVAVAVASGTPDRDALKSVIRDWIVPLMVKQFLVAHGIEPPQIRNLNKIMKSSYRTSLQGAREGDRVNKTL